MSAGVDRPASADDIDPARLIRAAGALPWRCRGGRLEVAVVHRPKYDDWSWPKGKLDPGESWPAAAVREVREETGLAVQLGIPLPHATYEVERAGRPRPKVVQYWAAQVDGSQAEPLNEVDDVAWLGIEQARARLDYRRDRQQLRALCRAANQGQLLTWPLIVVRHASAVPRRQWTQDDTQRPLDRVGRARAEQLVPMLSAYGVTRVVTSGTARCTGTVIPYAHAVGARLQPRQPLSEEGFAEDPTQAPRTLQRVLELGEPTVVCTHRKVLPALLGALADRAGSEPVAGDLRESAGPGLVKGEALVAHLSGVGEAARVVAVERHDA